MPITANAGVHAVAGLTADADLPGLGITVIFVVADVLSILRITDFFAVAANPQQLLASLLLLDPYRYWYPCCC
jgi:hypothetical protein